MREMSVRTFQKRFLEGDFDSNDRATQCEAGWYDWFCNDSSLGNKTKLLGKAVSQLKDSDKVKLGETYVFFKNNCPMDYPLYDDFRICSLEDGSVLYTVAHKYPFDKSKKMWTVHAICEGMQKDSDGYESWTTYSFSTTKEMTQWFNEKEEKE